MLECGRLAYKPMLPLFFCARPEWNPRSGFGTNYATLGLVSNVNQLEPRETIAHEPRQEEDVEMGTDPKSDAADDEIQDDDLRAALSKPRKGGPGPPAKLTSIQRRCVGKLLEKYGEDTKRMQLDRKLNPMQHAESVLRKMIRSFRYWKPDAGVDFRAPQKVLWRVRHCG